MSRRITPHNILGVGPDASKEQIKETFRKLCMEWHPDRVPEHKRAEAAIKFKSIKDAYDAILRGHAGYSPPPPGSAASAAAADAYSSWRVRDDFQQSYKYTSQQRTGPYGGYASELAFYRAMFRGRGDSPVGLILIGLAAIPLVNAAVSIWNGEVKFVNDVKNQGLNYFSSNQWKVNGRNTAINPYSIRSLDDIGESYIYKHERYAHLRPMYDKYRKDKPPQQQPQQQPEVLAVAAAT